ncbi:hypothetical protein [Vibrio mediterranei]|uniref:hypothetical protein n=1 Tax=Vibrio mediterranei TaxID=689 RepID=UPI004067FDDA
MSDKVAICQNIATGEGATLSIVIGDEQYIENMLTFPERAMADMFTFAELIEIEKEGKAHPMSHKLHIIKQYAPVAWRQIQGGEGRVRMHLVHHF